MLSSILPFTVCWALILRALFVDEFVGVVARGRGSCRGGARRATGDLEGMIGLGLGLGLGLGFMRSPRNPQRRSSSCPLESNLLPPIRVRVRVRVWLRCPVGIQSLSSLRLKAKLPPPTPPYWGTSRESSRESTREIPRWMVP